MKKYILISLLLSASSVSLAGTGLNCSNLDVIGQDTKALEACVTQTNDELNATYKELRATHKNKKDKLKALKDMQNGWIKMRDAQCLFQGMNAVGGGGAAQTGIRCEIKMTIKREEELSQL